jgi:hypothetical protein
MIPFQFRARSVIHGDHNIDVPAGLKTKAELFAFLKRAIPLPDYFGHNWDALEECLLDLREGDGAKVVLIHEDIPLHGAPTEQRTYLEILAKAARHSKRLVVIFPEDSRTQVEAVLK